MRSAFACRNSRKRENGPNLALIMTKKRKTTRLFAFILKNGIKFANF